MFIVTLLILGQNFPGVNTGLLRSLFKKVQICRDYSKFLLTLLAEL